MSAARPPTPPVGEGALVRAAEEKLERAVAFQRAVLRVIPDSVHVADAAAGSHVWTSQELGHRLGYSDGQLAAMSDDRRELVHPDDLHLLEVSLHAARHLQDGDVTTVRHRALAADGTVRWFDRRKTPFLRGPDGVLLQYLSVVQDVTEVVASERARADDLAFREAVLRASPDVISVLDLYSHQTVWASRRVDDLLGYSLEHVRERQRDGDLGWMHPEDRAAYRSHAGLAGLADGEVVTGRVRVQHADGRWLTYERRATPFRRDAAGRVTQVLVSGRDVTGMVDAAAELERVRGFEQAVIRTTPDVILLLDAVTTQVRWASRDLVEAVGRTTAELLELGAHAAQRLVLAEDVPLLADATAQVRRSTDGEVVHARFRVHHPDGQPRWLSCRMTPFRRDDAGAVVELLATLRDVTDVVDAEARLERAALHDTLTGLPNRRLVLDRLRVATAALARGGELAVLYLDLDGFKRVNDLAGHASGDAVLLEVGERLRAAVRPGDTVGRMGGDEFVVLLAGEAGRPAREVAEEVGARIRHQVRRPVVHEGVVHEVAASVGVAYGGPCSRPEDLLRDADAAMYRAKATGKDRTCVFDPEERRRARHRAELDQDLRRALEQDRVEVHFQPLVSTTTGLVVGAEALLRVQDGRGGHLPAGQAVSVAEETGLIRQLGERVLHLACRHAAQWHDPLPVSVNVSARELSRPGFRNQVMGALVTTGLPPERLVLELTETVLLEAARSTVRDLERLRNDGIGIALDDFGTGWGSMRYLMELPVSSLKVDGSFTAGVCSDAGSRALVRATIGLARDMGLTCVVEGVETEDQLVALGRDPHLAVQGYLLGRPGPGEPRRTARVPAPRGVTAPASPVARAGSR